MSYEDIVHFAERQGYDLLPWQADLLRDIQRGCLVSRSRRNGNPISLGGFAGETF